jgi:hypothetical protein
MRETAFTPPDTRSPFASSAHRLLGGVSVALFSARDQRFCK